MKKSIKQIGLIFLTMAMVVSMSAALASCGKKTDATTTNPVIPGISTSGTTAGTGSTASTEGTGATSATTAGTQGTTSTPVNPPKNEGDYINPLTGLKTNYNNPGLKPIAVVVDNINAAYAHQTGLTQADILYETLVAPGISRFMMLVSDYNQLKEICNIRSARLEHLDIIGSHNAIMVAHNGSTYNDFVSVAAARLGGGWDEALGKNTFGYVNTMKDVAFTKEGGEKYGTIKYYTSDPNYRTDIAHDTLLTTKALVAVFQSRYSLFAQSGATQLGETKSFDFVPVDTQKVMNGTSAKNISLSLTIDNAAGTKSVAYAYDAALGMYLRSQDGKAHKDAVTGEQLAFTNVITLFTDVSSEKGTDEDPVVATTKIVGEGTGYYFYGGEAIEIKWSKSAWDANLVLMNADGSKLELARGTTYVGYLDNTSTATAVIFN